jgi:hypothetical protein
MQRHLATKRGAFEASQPRLISGAYLVSGPIHALCHLALSGPGSAGCRRRCYFGLGLLSGALTHSGSGSDSHQAIIRVR